MNEVVVRTAELADLEKLLEFEQGIVGFERQFDETLKPGEIHYYDLRAMILADHVEVAVALIGDEVVASGYARIDPAKDYQRYPEYAYLGCMYVAEEHRGKGINNLVLEALKSWCLSKGIAELRLEVYSYNQQAIKAYEKAGFKPILTWMRLGI
jgi:GNAT superfamily N-acetyltransferase